MHASYATKGDEQSAKGDLEGLITGIGIPLNAIAGDKLDIEFHSGEGRVFISAKPVNQDDFYNEFSQYFPNLSWMKSNSNDE
jgi:hypothetical protein